MIEGDRPDYPLSWVVLSRLGWAILRRTKRSFREDALKLVAGGKPAIRISGEENIPRSGPACITVNHYWSPSFWAPWLAIAISALVPDEIYWTVTDAFTYPGRPFEGLRRSASHLLLTRVAQVYGFNSMPPMPPAPGEVIQRAQAVQRLLAYARKHPDCLVGLAPEGHDRPGGILDLPPEGVGRLGLALARRGFLFYPVGIAEDGRVLRICFGRPYRLEEGLQTTDRRHADLDARTRIAQEISRCLPERLRGQFSQSLHG